MSGITTRTIRAVGTLACLFATNCFAEDATVETVLSGLNYPNGVAVRPNESANVYEVFVSDSGAGRIVKVRSDQTNTSSDAITGFAAESGGPHALFFLERDHLVVASDGQLAVRMYELSNEPTPLTADNPKQTVEHAAVESVFEFARTRDNDNVPDLLIVAGSNLEWPAGIGKIPIRAGTLGKLSPLVSKSSHDRRSFGVAVDKHGYVAVGHTDMVDNSRDSSLTFYDPATGMAAVSFPIALHLIHGLAYHPTNDNLYALDHGSDAQSGGLYRLDDASQPGKPACKAVKIATINRPTALAFAPDGTLYITAPRDKQGELLRVRGGL